MAVSSIVASDLIPLKQRALFQGLGALTGPSRTLARLTGSSTANLWFGAGSGLGGPLGGFISDRLGWRTAFLGEFHPLDNRNSFSNSRSYRPAPDPLYCRDPRLPQPALPDSGAGQEQARDDPPHRLLGLTHPCAECARLVLRNGAWYVELICERILQLGSLLFSLSYKNDRNLPWSSPFVWIPLITFVVFGIAFVSVEAFWSAEPVMPLRILRERNGLFVALGNFTTSFVSFSVRFFDQLEPNWTAC